MEENLQNSVEELGKLKTWDIIAAYFWDQVMSYISIQKTNFFLIASNNQDETKLSCFTHKHF